MWTNFPLSTCKVPLGSCGWWWSGYLLSLMSLDYFLDISAPSDAGANVVTCMELISVDISNCEISGSYSLPHHR